MPTMADTADTGDMGDMVDMEAMVDTAAREKPNHTTDTEVVMEVMVDTDVVDTVDTDTVDTVESVKPKLPQNHTTEAMVDTDTVDTLMASKRLISNISPLYISPTLNLESFTKIQDNMYWQLVITPKSLQNL